MDAKMHTGMLWYDPEKTTSLDDRIGRGASYYRSKYGQDPNICFVNPKMLEGVQPGVAGIEVRPTRSVMPNYFWLGVSA